MTPSVSVIIPTFNRANMLGRAIESVLAQTYPDFELIIVDDGSTDQTAAVAQSYADSRIRYLPQANAGVAAARNTGLSTASGRYVAFLDSDDRFLPHKLAVQVSMLDSRPELGLVAGGYRVVDEAGQPVIERRRWLSTPNLGLETWLYSCPVTIHSVLTRRDWLTRVGGFDPALNGQAEDWDLWLRLAHAGCQMAWTPEVVCIYHLHSDQRVRDGIGQRNSSLALLDKFFSQSDLPNAIRQRRQHVYATAYTSAALREYAAGQLDAARQDLATALELDPTLVQGNPPPLLFVVASWAADPLLVKRPTPLIERVLDNLPPPARRLRDFRDRLQRTTLIWSAVDAALAGNRDLAYGHLTSVVAENPALTVEILVDALAHEPPARQQEAIEAFFADLPQARGLQPYRRKALGRLFAGRGFDSYQVGNVRQAARSFWQAVRLDPSWLGNRGVWSVWLKAIKG